MARPFSEAPTLLLYASLMGRSISGQTAGATKA